MRRATIPTLRAELAESLLQQMGPHRTALDAACADLQVMLCRDRLREAYRARILKRPEPTLESVFDKLYAAGVSIGVNGHVVCRNQWRPS